MQQLFASFCRKFIFLVPINFNSFKDQLQNEPRLQKPSSLPQSHVQQMHAAFMHREASGVPSRGLCAIHELQGGDQFC